jgi:GGDEF domain-containing protein
LGCLLGSGVVLLLDRRLPPVKFMFSIAQFALHACIAVLVIHALDPASGGVGPGTWIAAVVATQASGLVTVMLIAWAISLSEGIVRLKTILHMLQLHHQAYHDPLTTLANRALFT